MSAAVESEMMFCASCGTAGSDNIKLKNCDDCDLVRYCSVKCQEDHMPEHKKECKKRAAELKDEILFKQPENNHYGDCPICCLPIPINPEKSCFYTCCTKYVCKGCSHANIKREIEGRLEQKCPFCRNAAPKTDEECNERLMKRIEVNDPVAMIQIGMKKYKEGDYRSAFEYSRKAADLGDVMSHYQVSCLYRTGQGVEKDEKKALHHLTEAAIGGHPDARYNLALMEGRMDRVDRAVKHFIIAAKLGHDDSLTYVKNAYKAGYASKEDFNAALRGYQAAIEATKSHQREEASRFMMRTP